uniref:Reverse transcriptase domain-containing protein n=1 Tax=Nicotiana tabacum TaxID=4097 RepID=A0A1S3ZNR7_TOBAC|nr:PREDICTED: uncharacterized protein LOC107788721 [Nicotiana tabacum]
MEQNLEICRYSTLEEVEGAVFELSDDRASGLDGFTRSFYQECWEIVCYDIHNMVRYFYGGTYLPKSIIHPNLVLLPKKPRVQIFSDLRPISLSNFINKTDPLNNLAYTDDTIIFASSHPNSLKKVIAVLGSYEKISCHLINKSRSSYYMHANVANALFQAVGDVTRFSKGKFSFTYLGCLIFYTRRRKDYYEDRIKKLKAKMHSWKGKLLSYGGKATLITSVLQSMSVHLLSVLDPPNNILEHLHKLFVWLFWSAKEEGRSRNWSSWHNLCLLKEEGGLGFRYFVDVSKALFAKLWWRFRTIKLLWSYCMWNKYYKKKIPTVVQYRGGSHIWRKMLNTRQDVEHEVWWEMQRGSTNVWHKNWTKLGFLYHVVPPDFPINQDIQEVADWRQGEWWNEQLLEQTFPKEIVDHSRHIAGKSHGGCQLPQESFL